MAGKVDLLLHSYLSYVLQLKDGSTVLESLIMGNETGKTVLTHDTGHIKSSIFPVPLGTKHSVND